MNGDGDDARMVTAQFAVVYLNWVFAGSTFNEQNIRDWARRGHIGRHGRGPRGRTLYDLPEILAYLDAR